MKIGNWLVIDNIAVAFIIGIFIFAAVEVISVAAVNAAIALGCGQ